MSNSQDTDNDSNGQHTDSQLTDNESNGQHNNSQHDDNQREDNNSDNSHQDIDDDNSQSIFDEDETQVDSLPIQPTDIDFSETFGKVLFCISFSVGNGVKVAWSSQFAP